MYSERFYGVHILAKYHTLSFFNVRQTNDDKALYTLCWCMRELEEIINDTFGFVRVFEH